MSVEIWPPQQVPAETVAAVRAQTPELVQGVMAAIVAENSVYAAVLEGPEGLAIRVGIEQAVSTFLDAVQRGERPSRGAAELWRRLGEAEFQAGRSLEALRGAFRTGIRAAWRGAADLGVRAGLSAEMVITLAEAIFVYSDVLATDVVEGYVRAQSDEAGELERRRRRLAELLVDGTEHEPETLAHAAELARWPLPEQLAAIVVDARPAAGALSARSIHPAALAGGEGWALLPDPEAPGRSGELARVLAEIPSVIGPAVPCRGAGHSLRWARLTLDLVARRVLPDGRPTRSDAHLGTLLVHSDPALAGHLLTRRLAPLQGLPAGERQRLEETLRSWLDHQRHAPSVAAALHVHPQTVRYRLARLRELLGDVLEDPDGRFELALALRAATPGAASDTY